MKIFTISCLLLIPLFLFSFLAPHTATAQDTWIKTIAGSESGWAKDITSDREGNIYMTGTFDKSLMIDDQNIKSEHSKNVFLTKFSSTSDMQWIKKLEGTGLGNARALAADNNTNIYIGIEQSGNLQVEGKQLKSAAGTNLSILKFDQGGNLVWSKSAAGTGQKILHALETDDENNVYAAGTFQQTFTMGNLTETAKTATDGFILKLDGNGNPKWLKKVQSTKNGSVSDIDISNDALYVAGTFTGEMTIGQQKIQSTGSKFDAYLSKFDLNGNSQWVRHPMGSFDEIPVSIATDNTGSVFMAGGFQLNIQFGQTTLTSAKDMDMFLAKYNADGALQWVRQGSGGVGDDWANDVIVDDDGNALIVGTFLSSLTFGDFSLRGPSEIVDSSESVFLVRYSTDGDVEKGKYVGASHPGIIDNVLLSDNTGNIYLAATLDHFAIENKGQTKIGNKGTPTVFLWKAGSNGQIF